jgi:hypothetical protein
MNQGKQRVNKKKRRFHKRTVFLSSGIILFLFVTAKSFQEAPQVEVPVNDRVANVMADLNLEHARRPIIVSSKITYKSDRYSRNRWKRFSSLSQPLGESKEDRTDYFEVKVSDKNVDSVLVQTVAGRRVSHSRLHGPGSRVVDGNGFEIYMESFEDGKYLFAVSNRQPRAALDHIYFKFHDNNEVLGEEGDVKIARIVLKMPK